MDFDKIKAKVGLGSAKIEIHIPKEKYRLDEPLKGEVLLLGGNVKQEITALNISLIRDWSWECYSAGMDMDFTPGIPRAPYSTNSVSIQSQYELDGDKGSDEVLNIELMKNFEIKPEEERKFLFEIDLTSIQKENGVNEEWKLKARADIPFGKDSVAEQTIDLIESRKH